MMVNCKKYSEYEESVFPTVSQQVNNLSYYKDVKSGLCFVDNEISTSNGFTNHIFINVPCTVEVEKLIKK